LLSCPISSLSVEPTTGNFVGGFPFRRRVWVHSVVENDESCPNLVENSLDDVDAEAGEAVAVGNHNLSDHTLLDLFQKPLQPLASFEVEARGDVFEDAVVGEFCLERFDLALEVVALLPRRDPTVDGTMGIIAEGRLRLCCLVLAEVERSRLVCLDRISGFIRRDPGSSPCVDVVPPMPAACSSGWDTTHFGPSPQGLGADSQLGAGFA
jgi:hypothetical protein